ncbi:hypothetical protein BJ322DRAFT_1109302 [Thelephora terrestris]|uniref:F-box domain-containing protein n=1 Tax=Thelephora terrestris TaxID=56493 RepID=A0A9P6HDI6_9AGAM|nr:hypothetical protein BJ322DRAFT_1109302 [Thelephora terrestris]
MPPSPKLWKESAIRATVTQRITALEDALKMLDRSAVNESSISFLKELDMKFCQLQAYSRTIRNLTSVDQALPDDVLYMVLEQACVVPQENLPLWRIPSFTRGLSTFSSDTARALSSVCRRWRQLLSNPVVWSDVNVFARSADSLHWVESCLSRSTHMMKSMVRIDQPTKHRYDVKGIGIPVVIARHRSKIRGLYLKTVAISDFDFMNIEMVNLERLHLVEGSYPGDNLPTSLSLANFPGLRVLTLEKARLFPAKELVHITDLTLDSCVSPIDLSAILAVAPIEKLRLRKVSLSNGRGDIRSVPNLKLLVIESASAIEILRSLPALQTTATVYIYDEWTQPARSKLGMLPVPYSIFGDGNPVHTISVSIHPRLVTFVLRTSDGGRTEVMEAAPAIAGDCARVFLEALFADIGARSVLVDACSMEINVHHTAAHLICENTISRLLLTVPRITQVFLRGPTLFHHVCNALSSDQGHGRLLPGLTSLNVNLYYNDSFLKDLPLLCDVVAGRPSMWKIAFSGTEKQTRSILKEGEDLAERLEDQGIRVFLLTSSPLSM